MNSTFFRTLFFVAFFTISTTSWAAPSVKEPVLTKDNGYFTCSGQASAILFKQNCLEVTLDRVSSGANIVYEGTCLDPNGKKFRLSCTNFVFEPEALDANAKKNYFDR
jgi:hypothetical protein